MQNNKMILFDLDGTLWDSAVSVAESWNIVGKRYMPKAEQLTAQDIRDVMGLTMSEIVMQLSHKLPPIDKDIAQKMFFECMTYEVEYVGEHGGVLFPNEREVLQKLLDNGYKLGIVSNCQTGYIKAFLKSMKMEKYFCDFEEWGEGQLTKGQNILKVIKRNNVAKVVYVGDTQKDCDASSEAGVPFIFASYGFGDANYYEGVIDSFDQLPEIVKQLLG